MDFYLADAIDRMHRQRPPKNRLPELLAWNLRRTASDARAGKKCSSMAR
jgi:hypothetical protein